MLSCSLSSLFAVIASCVWRSTAVFLGNLLSTSDPHMSPRDVALGYKTLQPGRGDKFGKHVVLTRGEGTGRSS